MLRVNLLPEAYRASSLSPVEQFHRTPLFWIILVVVFILPVVIPLPLIHLREQAIRRLTNRLAELEPKRAHVEQLRKAIIDLHAREQALESLKRNFWAKRLNLLSDLTPEGVWFTEMTLDPSRGLIIQGAAVGEGAEVMSVGRLVQNLKAAPEFISALKDLQIESIKRVQERDMEIVQFTLTAALNPDATSGPTGGAP